MICLIRIVILPGECAFNGGKKITLLSPDFGVRRKLIPKNDPIICKVCSNLYF